MKWTFVLVAAWVLFTACERQPEISDKNLVELNVLMSPDSFGTWHELFDEFHRRNPRIRINHIEGPTATNTREDMYVTSFLSGRTTYDLVYADVVWIPKFAAAGWLEDLTGYWPVEEWERFIAGSLKGSMYKGRIFRVPTQMNGGVLFYRTDLLKMANEQPPETFAEMVRIARALQRAPELWGFVWQGKQYEGLVCDYLEVLIGHGGFWIDPDNGDVGLDQPAAIQALEFLRNCIQRWRISPPGVTTYAEEESRQIFHAGRAIFHRNWPYAWELSQKPDSPIRGKVGIVPMPHTASGEPASTLGGWGFSIARSSRHKAEAWEFIEYISALPQIRRLYEVGGAEPALKEFYEQSDDPALEAIYHVLQTTVPRPPVPQYAQASDILQRYVSAALTDRMSSEAAMRAAARETRLLLGRSSR